MDISIKKALKAPFSWTLLIIAFLLTIPSLFAIQSGIDLTGQTPVAPNAPFLQIYFVSLLCLFVVSGYTILFGHNTIQKAPVLFPSFSTPLIKTAIKAVVFHLGIMVILIPLIGILMLINMLPVEVGFALAIVLILFMIFYVVVASARFMDTLRMRTPFQITENLSLLKKYWLSFVVIFLYNFIIYILFSILMLALTLVFGTLMLMYPTALYLTIFVNFLVNTYMYLVLIHVFAQGYAWIKNNRAMKALAVPMTASKPTPVKAKSKPAPIKTVKAAPKAKPSVKKTVVVKVAKPIIKAKAAPKKTVKAKKKA